MPFSPLPSQELRQAWHGFAAQVALAQCMSCCILVFHSTRPKLFSNPSGSKVSR